MTSSPRPQPHTKDMLAIAPATRMVIRLRILPYPAWSAELQIDGTRSGGRGSRPTSRIAGRGIAPVRGSGRRGLELRSWRTDSDGGVSGSAYRAWAETNGREGSDLKSVTSPGRQAVGGAADAVLGTAMDASVDHRRANVTMAEQALYGACVVTGIEHMTGERMPESAAGGGLREAGPQDGDPDGALDDGLVKVMAVTPARDRMAVGPGGGEDPLPGPFAGSRRIGAVRAIRQVDPTGAAGDVHFVEPPSKVELSREVGLGARGEDRHAALGSRSAADRDRVAREIDVFDPQAAALDETQAGSVEKRGHEPGGAVHLVEEGLNLTRREHEGKRPGYSWPIGKISCVLAPESGNVIFGLLGVRLSPCPYEHHSRPGRRISSCAARSRP